MFVDRVFATLDDDHSGCIEWDEFLKAMSALERGSREGRAKFLFQVYDIDHDGGISKGNITIKYYKIKNIKILKFIYIFI